MGCDDVRETASSYVCGDLEREWDEQRREERLGGDAEGATKPRTSGEKNNLKHNKGAKYLEHWASTTLRF